MVEDRVAGSPQADGMCSADVTPGSSTGRSGTPIAAPTAAGANKVRRARIDAALAIAFPRHKPTCPRPLGAFGNKIHRASGRTCAGWHLGVSGGRASSNSRRCPTWALERKSFNLAPKSKLRRFSWRKMRRPSCVPIPRGLGVAGSHDIGGATGSRFSRTTLPLAHGEAERGHYAR
jgi:hypothetical protein